MKLYFSPGTSSLATHIALIECGADFELIPRFLTKEETRTPEFKAINPDGKVPVLVTDDGHVVTEVAATLYYLARKYPAANLWPEGDLNAETEVLSWLSFAASTLHGSRGKGAEAMDHAFSVVDQKLSDRDWLTGRYTIADIHVFRIYWKFKTALEAPAGTYPALESYHDRMLARPAVIQALDVEDGFKP